MKASEIIKTLEDIIKINGDLEVKVFNGNLVDYTDDIKTIFYTDNNEEDKNIQINI